MNILQVKKFFTNKEHTPCPITERLIKNGYQQTSGGYIKLAKQANIPVDYTKALPSQYWHLIVEYCPSVPESKSFTKSIVCGELIFWMAEVSKAVPENTLQKLADEIISNADTSNNRPVYDRKRWNKAIQDACFDAIVAKVESEYPM